MSNFQFFKRKGMIDVIVVFALFVVSAILVLGLFPRENWDEGRLLYLYTMMGVPILIAIYFILVSFRRTVSRKAFEADSSIRTKISAILMFLVILPLVPVVFISNNMIQRVMDSAGSVETRESLERANAIVKNEAISFASQTRAELDWMRNALDNGEISVQSYEVRSRLSSILRSKGFMVQCFEVLQRGELVHTLMHMPDAMSDAGDVRFSKGIRRFISIRDLSDKSFVSNLTIEGRSVIVGGLVLDGMVIAIYRPVPAEFAARTTFFSKALENYSAMEKTRQRLKSLSGLLLLVVSIVVLVIAIFVSLNLSRNIANPMLEIAEAAKSVAAGNFDVSLSRKSNDEILLLFQSFNSMTRQLKENRETMYIAQKLNAWREVSRKLIHEIRNPLTPIKLSAERIRLRYGENHPDMGAIVQKGTETIIDEVNAIRRILDEFTTFARLPEVKPDKNDFNKAVKKIISLFHAHEKIHFQLSLDDALPPVLFDRPLIRQALVNIIKNSIEAMNGEGTIEVLTGRAGPRFAFVTVKDHGPGIASDDIARLFEPTFTRKAGGTGLGLSIVEKITLDHKGRVYCKSSPGEGAAFTVELPVAED
jgi:nitrogen fixation/metabolism regulation signal transduction histidine kinase